MLLEGNSVKRDERRGVDEDSEQCDTYAERSELYAETFVS